MSTTTAETGTARRTALATLPGDDVRQIMWRYSDRYDLQIGARVQGPAVIEEFGSTTVIGLGERMSIGTLGEMVIDLQ